MPAYPPNPIAAPSRPLIMAAALLALGLGPMGARGDAPVEFARDIHPILSTHCVKCHGPEEQNAGLRYDSRQAALGMADSGHHAIVPGDPGSSELLRRIVSTDKDVRMPPKGEALGVAEAGLLQRWIQEGAAWPETTSAPPPAAKVASTHWSFQPLSDPAPPTVADESWPMNPIDRFLLARREKSGLPAVADAAPAVLLRRVVYDLTGLPPTEQEVRDYTEAASAVEDVRQPFSNLVDRLLATREYGERWGRHWLDWARYADTAGDNSDFPIPQAWLYRKYVIDALNRDVPYDRFLTEQLAGDLLPASSQEEKNRLTIATGYLAMARRFGSLVETYPQHLTIEDTIDNLGRTVFGLTLSCARCHDHKFDPVSTRDYYGLYGIFASTRYPFPGIELFQTQWDFAPLVPKEEVRAKWGPHEKDTARLTAELEKQLAACRTMELDHAKRSRSADVEEQRRLKGEMAGLLGRTRKAGENLADHLKKLPPLPTAYAVRDDRPANAKVQLKGEPDRPGAEVPRKFPDVLGGYLLPAEATGSGRLELARWITAPENPLTARVIVNRVWQRHFGRGLVPSTSDFGLRGEAPEHPKLLDWLARDFMKHGWSLKHLHRLILTSRTWQLSSADTEAGVASDPGNTLYWKSNRRRLDAESLRDTLLFVSGELDPAPQAEPYPIPPADKWEYTQHHPFKADYPSKKRSVYQMTKRLTAQPYLQTFDGPDPNVCTTTRETSVTALQALFFVNDTFLQDQAGQLASRLAGDPANDAARLETAFLTLLARPPSPAEGPLLLAQLQHVRSQGLDDTAAWASVTRTLLRLNEFLYLD